MQGGNTNLSLDAPPAVKYHFGMVSDFRVIGAERLQALMDERKLSQTKLAAKSGVTQAELSRFLRDPQDSDWRPISEGAAKKLAMFFKVPAGTFRIAKGSLDELLIGADPDDVAAIWRMAINAASKHTPKK